MNLILYLLSGLESAGFAWALGLVGYYFAALRRGRPR